MNNIYPTTSRDCEFAEIAKNYVNKSNINSSYDNTTGVRIVRIRNFEDMSLDCIWFDIIEYDTSLVINSDMGTYVFNTYRPNMLSWFTNFEYINYNYVYSKCVSVSKPEEGRKFYPEKFIQDLKEKIHYRYGIEDEIEHILSQIDMQEFYDYEQESLFKLCYVVDLSGDQIFDTDDMNMLYQMGMCFTPHFKYCVNVVHQLGKKINEMEEE